MSPVDKADLAVLVACIKAVEQARLNAFYKDSQTVKAVEEFVSPGRLRDIARAVGKEPRDGLLNDSGTAAVTKEIIWRGCRFWAVAE